MEDEQYKEVYFHEYCKTCKHKDVKDQDEPCNTCLEDPINLYSHKPVKYEKADNKSVKQKPHVTQ